MRTKQIADVFQISPAWARRVKQRRRENGETRPRPMGGATVIKIDMDRLRQLVEEQPDATIRELHQRLGGRTCCCESAVGFALQRLGLSFKKRRCVRRSRTGRTWRRRVSSGVRSNPGVSPGV
jgi:transposase